MRHVSNGKQSTPISTVRVSRAAVREKATLVMAGPKTGPKTVSGAHEWVTQGHACPCSVANWLFFKFTKKMRILNAK
jgi:hypothetical protein